MLDRKEQIRLLCSVDPLKLDPFLEESGRDLMSRFRQLIRVAPPVSNSFVETLRQKDIEVGRRINPSIPRNSQGPCYEPGRFEGSSQATLCSSRLEH